MRTRPGKFKSNLWLKWAVLLAFWIFSFLILIIVTGNNGLNALYDNALSCGLGFRLPKNQIGFLRYTRWDPKENYRPIYSISFKNLLAENSRLGIFKTALYKVVKIRDLELRFYEYTTPKVTETTKLNHGKTTKNIAARSVESCITTKPYISPTTEDTIANTRALIKEIIRKLTSPENLWRVNKIDLGNISEVRINNFDYKVFYDDDLSFAIQSKRAVTSYKQSELALRGHVIITAADGSTLECNYAKWGTKTGYFKIDGVYVLNRNGMKMIGKDICVDTQLNLARAQQAKYEHKEAERCFAKL